MPSAKSAVVWSKPDCGKAVVPLLLATLTVSHLQLESVLQRLSRQTPLVQEKPEIQSALVEQLVLQLPGRGVAVEVLGVGVGLVVLLLGVGVGLLVVVLAVGDGVGDGVAAAPGIVTTIWLTGIAATSWDVSMLVTVVAALSNPNVSV